MRNKLAEITCNNAKQSSGCVTRTLTGLDCTTPISCCPWGWTSYHWLFPSQDHLQREESWKGRNDQSAHWQLAVQFYLASTTSAAPVQQQVTSWLSEVETDSHSDVVDRVVGSSLSSLNDKSSPETDFIPGPCVETLPPSKYGQKAGTGLERRLC